MVKANNNIESVYQNLLQSHDPKGLQENTDKIVSLIESMKKLSIADLAVRDPGMILGIQPVKTLKEIVRGGQPVHILKEMVRFVKKVVGKT
ncbi:8984_t:CDS:2 [Diversispora eburnea]|uniref:8984_t:CDS:1 n=1 Tax=Diversispora eburnea TaxID=1213867 RepID=A0A9N9CLS8_9GLOM|nr:8984_t:CDS:2 [Diversispora eburnea]